MNPKHLIDKIKDHNLDLQERIFRLLTFVALIGFLILIIVGVVLGDSFIDMTSLIISFILFCVITVFALTTGKTRLGANLIACIVVFGLLPIAFFTGGGIYGGSPLWFVFCFVYICLVVYGKIRYFFLVCAGIMTLVCYGLGYFYPALIKEHTVNAAYLDSLISILIVSTLICLLFLFESDIFISENRISNQQKKEIEEMNQAQNRFFSSMSHEIRTPINTIIGLNEMIMREEISDEVAEDAKNIQAASKMLLALINDILDMSKIESGKMDIVSVTYDVGTMLSDIVNMTWSRAKEKGLEFHVDVDQTMPTRLYGDEVRIKQVLINILNNAVKYTKEGSVTLSIQCKKSYGKKALITYTVTDTGMGIKKESIPHLFTAFKRVDQAENRYIEGTGLGLSIVKQIVDLMGGKITVNSVYTKGSTFIVELNQEIADASELGDLNLESRHMLGSREHYKQSFEAPKAHILLVDDNEANLMVATKLLRDTRVQIDTAMSGEEALTKTVQMRYDTIFMDHLMPEMDGIECLHAIRSQVGGLNRETPTVALTANAGSENQALYSREGFDGYLLKPVSGELLEAELVKHLPRELVNIIGSDIVLSGGSDTFAKEHRKKSAILITTDSVCDLPKHIVQRRNIPVLPYRICTEDGYFLDGVETEAEGILAYMEDGERTVKSEPPEVSDYEEFFAEQLTKAQHIIHITMAKDVSDGYANAVEASRAFDNVTVIDSGHLSSGMGLLVLYANQRAKEGLSIDTIVQEVEQVKGRTSTSFVVGSTDYLARSGRISETVASISKAFMLHPVLVLRDSKMKIGAIRIGRNDYVRRKYIVKALNTLNGIDTGMIFITHAGMSTEELKEIEQLVRKRVDFKEIIFQKASPAISINCGPGSFGLLFLWSA